MTFVVSYLFFLMLWMFFGLIGYNICIAYMAGSTEEMIIATTIVSSWILAMCFSIFWKHVIGGIFIPSFKRKTENEQAEIPDNTVKSEGAGSGLLFVIIALIIYFMLK